MFGRPRRRPFLAITAGAMCVALAGCSPAAARRAAAAGPPRQGGTLTVGLPEDPVCLDPAQSGLISSVNIIRQLVDSLTDQDPKTGDLKPWLATSWDVNPTATSFTFHLRDGVAFSDGTPVDATAVRDNLDAVVALGAKSLFGATYLAGYKQTTVVDARTARVDFSQPNAQFLQATATTTLGLVSPATFRRPAADRCRSVVGSGPFVLKSYQPNAKVVLTARQGYTWGSPLAAHPGRPYLDTVTFQIVPEQSVRSGELASGQLDAITDVQPLDEKRFTKGGFTELIRQNPGAAYALYPNTLRPILGDQAVRLAISKGINRAQVVKTVLTPHYKPATSILASTTPGYVDLGADLGYDPAGAKKLLEEDGWTVGADGIRSKNGTRLSLSVYFTAGFNPNSVILQLIQQQVRGIGVDLRLRPVDAAQFGTAQKQGLIDFRWGNTTRTDPDILRTIFSTHFSASMYLRPSDLDDQLDAQVATSDQTQRWQIVAGVQRTILDQGYAVPVFELAQVTGVAAQAHGITLDASARLRLVDAWVAR